MRCPQVALKFSHARITEWDDSTTVLTTTQECHENDIKGKCPNGKCPSYEIYDILEGKWPSWWYRKMPFIWFLLCIKAKLFEFNVNWHVTPKTYLPNVNNATAFLFMKEEEKLIALLHSTTTAMRLSVVFFTYSVSDLTPTHQSIWWCHSSSSNWKKAEKGE